MIVWSNISIIYSVYSMRLWLRSPYLYECENKKYAEDKMIKWYSVGKMARRTLNCSLFPQCFDLPLHPDLREYWVYNITQESHKNLNFQNVCSLTGHSKHWHFCSTQMMLVFEKVSLKNDDVEYCRNETPALRTRCRQCVLLWEFCPKRDINNLRIPILQWFLESSAKTSRKITAASQMLLSVSIHRETA